MDAQNLISYVGHEAKYRYNCITGLASRNEMCTLVPTTILIRTQAILPTFPLSHAGVPSLPPCLGVLPDPRPRVHGHRLLDHKTILDQLADILPGVGIGNLVDLVGIEPDLVAAALHHRSGEPLL